MEIEGKEYRGKMKISGQINWRTKETIELKLSVCEVCERRRCGAGTDWPNRGFRVHIHV